MSLPHGHTAAARRRQRSPRYAQASRQRLTPPIFTLRRKEGWRRPRPTKPVPISPGMRLSHYFDEVAEKGAHPICASARGAQPTSAMYHDYTHFRPPPRPAERPIRPGDGSLPSQATDALKRRHSPATLHACHDCHRGARSHVAARARRNMRRESSSRYTGCLFSADAR